MLDAARGESDNGRDEGNNGLFHYLIIHPYYRYNKWCPGGYWEYVSGGGHLNACPGGLEGIIEACPGGEEQHRSLSRGKQKLVQGAFTSLSQGGGDII